MSDSLFPDKKGANAIAEVVNGTFIDPVGVPVFPINDVEMVAPELNLTEFGRPAVGKSKRGRFYPTGVQTASVAWTSFMMQPTDWTVATGDIEIGPIFEAAGFHIADGATDKYILFDGNIDCGTLSMAVGVPGCYSSTGGETTADADVWELRGAKNEITIGAEEVGSPIMVNITTQAIIEAKDESGTINIVDPAFLNTAVYDVFLGAAVTLDGIARDVQSFVHTTNPVISPTKDVSKSSGGKVQEMTDMDNKISVVILAGATTLGLWGDASTGTPVGDLIIQGQVFDYTYENCVISGYEETNVDGIAVTTLELTPRGDIKFEKAA